MLYCHPGRENRLYGTLLLGDRGEFHCHPATIPTIKATCTRIYKGPPGSTPFIPPVWLRKIGSAAHRNTDTTNSLQYYRGSLCLQSTHTWSIQSRPTRSATLRRFLLVFSRCGLSARLKAERTKGYSAPHSRQEETPSEGNT